MDLDLDVSQSHSLLMLHMIQKIWKRCMLKLYQQMCAKKSKKYHQHAASSTSSSGGFNLFNSRNPLIWESTGQLPALGLPVAPSCKAATCKSTNSSPEATFERRRRSKAQPSQSTQSTYFLSSFFVCSLHTLTTSTTIPQQATTYLISTTATARRKLYDLVLCFSEPRLLVVVGNLTSHVAAQVAVESQAGHRPGPGHAVRCWVSMGFLRVF